MSPEVRLDDETDRWRYVCPRGHRSWEPTNNHFWCKTCAQLEGVDAVFSELLDRVDNRTYEREELTLLTSFGPHSGGRHA